MNKMKHSTFRKSVAFNKIIIFDALSPKDNQTATYVAERLNRHFGGQGVSHKKVASADEFCELMKMLKDASDPAFEMNWQPIIHIEGHGSPENLHFPDHSLLSWDKVADYLRPVNKNLNNTLITFIGTCYAAECLKKSITISKFSPAWCGITPIKEIYEEDVREAALTFYETIRDTADVSAAARRLVNENIYHFDSDHLFHLTMHTYMLTHHRGSGLAMRVDKLISESIEQILLSHWIQMSGEDKSAYIRSSRAYLKEKLKSRDTLKTYFDRFSLQFLGYINDAVFEEIIDNMTVNGQKKIF